MMELQGDLINIDITVFKEGVHGDTSRTVFIPKEEGNEKQQRDEQCEKIIRAAHRAMVSGIEVCAPGVPFVEIAKVCFTRLCTSEY